MILGLKERQVIARDLLLRAGHEVRIDRVNLKPIHASGDQPLDVFSGQFAMTPFRVTKGVNGRKHISTASLETSDISAVKIARQPEPEGTLQVYILAPIKPGQLFFRGSKHNVF